MNQQYIELLGKIEDALVSLHLLILPGKEKLQQPSYQSVVVVDITETCLSDPKKNKTALLREKRYIPQNHK